MKKKMSNESNFIKHACQNMVAMEMSKLMAKGHWCQHFRVYLLGNVIKFGAQSFNGLEVTTLQSWRGIQKTPPSFLPPVWIGLIKGVITIDSRLMPVM